MIITILEIPLRDEIVNVTERGQHDVLIASPACISTSWLIEVGFFSVIEPCQVHLWRDGSAYLPGDRPLCGEVDRDEARNGTLRSLYIYRRPPPYETNKLNGNLFIMKGFRSLSSRSRFVEGQKVSAISWLVCYVTNGQMLSQD